MVDAKIVSALEVNHHWVNISCCLTVVHHHSSLFIKFAFLHFAFYKFICSRVIFFSIGYSLVLNSLQRRHTDLSIDNRHYTIDTVRHLKLVKTLVKRVNREEGTNVLPVCQQYNHAVLFHLCIESCSKHLPYA